MRRSQKLDAEVKRVHAENLLVRSQLKQLLESLKDMRYDGPRLEGTV